MARTRGRARDSSKRITSAHSVITRSTSIAATTFVLPSTNAPLGRRLRAPYLVHGNSARVPGRLARKGWGGGVEDKKKEREREEEGKKSVGTKEDQRRTDRARINCRNTGSSLSTSATHGFSSVGKYVECILNVSPTFLRSRGCGSLFPLI